MEKGSEFGLVLNTTYRNPPQIQHHGVGATKLSDDQVKEDRISAAIVVISATAAAFLPLQKPSTSSVIRYQAFVVSIIFPFSCALGAIFLYRKPQWARHYKVSAIAFLFSALLLLLLSAIFFNRIS